VKLFLQKQNSFAFGEDNRFPTGPTHQAESRPVPKRLPARIWMELMLGLMSTLSLALAIVLPDWMERLFGLAPDAGDGSAERGFALLWAAISVLMFGLAGRAWRKHVRLLRSA
jgi:hypothetical protein